LLVSQYNDLREQMNTIRLLAVSSLVFALGCAQTPADEDADGLSASNPEGIMCRREPDMGSRLGRKVCTTKAERDAAAQITREEITNRQRPGTATDSAAPPGT
jgi:hypothetical protein